MEESVEFRNDSCVNRLRSLIPRKNLRLRFPMMDNFNYRVLMHNPDIEIDRNVIRSYESLAMYTSGLISEVGNGKKDYDHFYMDVRSCMFALDYPESDIVDILVKYYFHIRRSKRKTVLWNAFGDIIAKNIRKNLGSKFTTCKHCGRRYMVKNDENGLCSECRKTPPEMKVGYRVTVCQDCGRDIGINFRTNKRTVRCCECQKTEERRKTALRNQNYWKRKRESNDY